MAQLERRDPRTVALYAFTQGRTTAALTHGSPATGAVLDSAAASSRQRRHHRPQSVKPSASERGSYASTPLWYGLCSQRNPQGAVTPHSLYRRMASRANAATPELTPTVTMNTPAAEAIIPKNLWASSIRRPGTRRRRRKRRARARSRTLPFYLISGALLTSARYLNWSVNPHPGVRRSAKR